MRAEDLLAAGPEGEGDAPIARCRHVRARVAVDLAERVRDVGDRGIEPARPRHEQALARRPPVVGPVETEAPGNTDLSEVSLAVEGLAAQQGVVARLGLV